ncbi:hypothetical protein [Bacillus kwashiorkori]|uniref:hypothetical protein n=1 Tax=Bacillus kwashiorkori TaxID=1522318 RepID=UPI000784CFCF|nr:hypothetical protein [Bacillus kwashiorkori]
MENRLQQTKMDYKQQPVLHFSSREKQKVLRKIEYNDTSVRKKHLLPRVMTVSLMFVITIIGFTYLNENYWHMAIFNQGNNGTLPHVIDKKTEKENYFTVIQESEGEFVTFDHANVKFGDKIGDFTVTNTQKVGQQTVIQLEGFASIRGDLFTDYQKVWYKPASIGTLPIAEADFGRPIFFQFDERSVKSLANSLHFQLLDMNNERSDGNVNTESFKDYSIRINKIQYKISEKGSEIQFSILDKLVINDTIELSGRLQSVYKEYANTLDETLLAGLQPFEVFQLYMHNISIGDLETEYGLLYKEHYPDKETYFSDPQWKPTETMIENGRQLYLEMKELDHFVIQQLDDDEVVIYFTMNGEERHFRLLKDQTTGVWKIPLVPMQ